MPRYCLADDYVVVASVGLFSFNACRSLLHPDTSNINSNRSMSRGYFKRTMSSSIDKLNFNHSMVNEVSRLGYASFYAVGILSDDLSRVSSTFESRQTGSNQILSLCRANISISNMPVISVASQCMKTNRFVQKRKKETTCLCSLDTKTELI